jgi:hypothetical protein
VPITKTRGARHTGDSATCPAHPIHDIVPVDFFFTYMDSPNQTAIGSAPASQRSGANPASTKPTKPLSNALIGAAVSIIVILAAIFTMYVLAGEFSCKTLGGEIVSQAGGMMARREFCAVPWVPTPGKGGACSNPSERCLGGGICAGFWSDVNIGGADVGGSDGICTNFVLFEIR